LMMVFSPIYLMTSPNISTSFFTLSMFGSMKSIPLTVGGIVSCLTFCTTSF
jgi:hypothetical protein